MRNIAKKIYSESTINFTEVDKFKINNNLNSLNKRIIDFNNKYNKTKNTNQATLFEFSSNMSINYPILPEAEEWEKEEYLKYEKELLGF